MPAVHVLDADGVEHRVDAIDGEPLMHALRDAGLVDAVCGGAMSCGTCAIAIDPALTAALAAPDEMESALLEGLDCAAVGARLSCQLVVTPAIAGATLRLLPSA